MAKIPRVPVKNQINTLSVIKIAIKFSPCTRTKNREDKKIRIFHGVAWRFENFSAYFKNCKQGDCRKDRERLKLQQGYNSSIFFSSQDLFISYFARRLWIGVIIIVVIYLPRVKSEARKKVDSQRPKETFVYSLLFGWCQRRLTTYGLRLLERSSGNTNISPATTTCHALSVNQHKSANVRAAVYR